MKRLIWCAGVGLGLSGLVGCAKDTTPPPPMASVPPLGSYSNVRGASPKPLPQQDAEGGAYQLAFEDEPLITQAPPEQPAFVEAYERVGRPRIALFVNRTFQGQPLVPPTTPPPDRKAVPEGAIELSPPARIDYDAVENILTDWFAGGGKVALVSAKLSEAQAQSVSNGEPNALAELSKKQQIDVLIVVQAAETRQTPRGVEIRLIGESVNTIGGESVGRAVVDLPPVLTKQVVNEYTRFVARKLMSDMTRTWNNAKPNDRDAVGPQPMQPHAMQPEPMQPQAVQPIPVEPVQPIPRPQPVPPAQDVPMPPQLTPPNSVPSTQTMP